MSQNTRVQFSVEELPAGASTPPPAWVARCASCGRDFASNAEFCPFDGERLQLQAAGFRHIPSDDLVGSVIDGRYQVLSELGRGGMGTVYRVSHVSLGRHQAIKVLRPELAGIPDLAERFLREARAAAAIEHPHVVRILDFGRLPSGAAYFVMELLEGMSLRELIARGPLSPTRAMAIARQVADGLHAAHRAGVIHRDLKPDNIQVDPRVGDFVKVLDFGLARVVGASRLTRQGVVFGTPHYMSPEQAAGESIDHRSDLYALGVVLYEMLTGRVPFDGDEYADVLSHHLNSEVPTPSSVHPIADLGSLEAIVMRCLAKSPSDRYANMVDLMAALGERNAAAVNRSLSVSSASRARQRLPQKRARARSWGRAAVVAAASMTLVGGLTWWARTPRESAALVSTARSGASLVERDPGSSVAPKQGAASSARGVEATTASAPGDAAGARAARSAKPRVSADLAPGAPPSGAAASGPGVSDPAVSDPGASDPGGAEASAPPPSTTIGTVVASPATNGSKVGNKAPSSAHDSAALPSRASFSSTEENAPSPKTHAGEILDPWAR